MNDTLILRLARLVPVLALVLTAGVAGAEEPATEVDDVSRAERYADQAYEANAKKEYARAIALYQQALEAAPSADMLYNIARIYDVGIRDRPLAISFYRRYLADPGALPERIWKANQRLQALRAAEAALESTNTSEAAARTRIRAPGAATRSPSDDTERALEPPYWSLERAAAVATGALGVVGVGVGTAFTISAIAKNGDAEADCDGNLCRTQAGVDAAQSARRRATIATIALSTGGVLAAAGGVLWLLSPPSTAEPHDTLGRIRWSPIAARSQVGVEISGGF